MNLDLLLDAFVGIMHKVNKKEKGKESKEIGVLKCVKLKKQFFLPKDR